MRSLRSVKVIVEYEGETGALGNVQLTDGEHETLCGRIRKYLRECDHRRQKEAADVRAAEQLGHNVCLACNDTGEVRKRVWNVKRKQWVYGKGTMPCPMCIEKDTKVAS